MVVQYPHTINVTGPTVSVQDGSGNWVNTAQTDFILPCRFEPAGSRGLVPGPDGKLINYNWIVYMPIPALDIKPGFAVRIYDGATLIAKDNVLRYSKGQLNARIWL